MTFRVESTTPQSGRGETSPAIDAVRTASGLRITVFQGQKTTGGYSVRVERVGKRGGELRVHASFSEPGPDAIVTQALTSPAQTISVDVAADAVVLVDQAGAERARTAPR
ncbi:MAG TPA: protease complex subunit PrcB family protein [Candidatus Limnocylindria bacterium]|nr:protease complex subunit PrcB family protein [Candidatus Limnocylindria bacterium]